MGKVGLSCAVTLTVVGLGCGATTRGNTIAEPTLTSASATFMTRDAGKDEDSAVAVQLLDGSSRLSAEATAVDVEYGDETVSPPLALTMTRPLRRGDLDDARVRLRLTPDGDDDWTFDLRMTLELSDGTSRTYFWEGQRLDNTAPERTLTLASGRLP